MLIHAILTDPHGHAAGGSHAAHGPEMNKNTTTPASGTEDTVDQEKLRDEESASVVLHNDSGFVVDSPATQILGVAILEFGVVLHRCVLFTFLYLGDR